MCPETCGREIKCSPCYKLHAGAKVCYPLNILVCSDEHLSDPGYGSMLSQSRMVGLRQHEVTNESHDGFDKWPSAGWLKKLYQSWDAILQTHSILGHLSLWMSTRQMTQCTYLKVAQKHPTSLQSLALIRSDIIVNIFVDLATSFWVKSHKWKKVKFWNITILMHSSLVNTSILYYQNSSLLLIDVSSASDSVDHSILLWCLSVSIGLTGKPLE